ncbi:hypothetical protein [Oceanospirillum sediminis]|uniref:Uncharacterized protein n=1 Tax=Oceanospirillum sediminis TaxID=2760088 RepID=A0A839IUH1_9GAMM|nr:hypothetical protein [Oceanospirillum sediminis]MBB1488598.1 hypothetical protein [Oceanospirillum sediminis]
MMTPRMVPVILPQERPFSGCRQAYARYFWKLSASTYKNTEYGIIGLLLINGTHD